MIDAATCGTINHKMPEESARLFEDMATNNYEWSYTRSQEKRPASVLDMDVATTIMSKVEALS